jgi:hypothetical protein
VNLSLILNNARGLVIAVYGSGHAEDVTFGMQNDKLTVDGALKCASYVGAEEGEVNDSGRGFPKVRVKPNSGGDIKFFKKEAGRISYKLSKHAQTKGRV